VGELLVERLRMTQPWYRMFTVNRRARTWLARINSVLEADSVAGTAAVTGTSTIDQLHQLQRAVALSAVALAEHTPVVMLDLMDAFADPREEARFLCALDRLAPATTTIVLGTAIAPRDFDAASVGRRVMTIDLDRVAALIAAGNQTREGTLS
jgi:RND superfamily putative drug exporter